MNRNKCQLENADQIWHMFRNKFWNMLEGISFLVLFLKKEINVGEWEILEVLNDSNSEDFLSLETEVTSN